MAKTHTLTHCYMIFLLTLCAGYLTTGCGIDCGEVRPKDPNAAIGQPIDLQCTLTEAFMNTTKYNSSHIIFKLMHPTSGERQHMKGMIFNQSTSRLYLAKVELQAGLWDVNCLVKKPEKKEYIDTQIMVVGYVPYKPTITDVYIFNWENLTIKWTVPNVNPYHIASNSVWYKLRYLYKRRNQWTRWKTCAKKTIKKEKHLKQTCTVKGLGMSADAIRVEINASNEVATVTLDMVSRSIPSLVLAGPVRDLQVLSTDKTAATLQWDSPKPKVMFTKLLDYQITYHSPRTDFYKTINLQSAKMNGLQTELTSLYPYTQYMVTVRCKDRASERWSENVTTSFYTQEDLPLQPPLVLGGNFMLILKKGGETRDAILYWQNVPPEDRNGNITKFRITTITRLSTIHKPKVLDAEGMKGDLSATMKDLALNERYNFLINAGNSVGFSQTDSQETIIIPPQEQIPPGIDASFLKLNNSSVRVMWPQIQQASSVTFYWCPGNMEQQDCTGEIRWKRVLSENSTNSVILRDPQFASKHLFGTSVEVMGRHSGIKWTSCDYNVKDPMPPKCEEKHASMHYLEFRLKSVDCVLSEAFIVGFVLRYCAVVSKQNQTCSEKAFSVSSTGEYRIQDLEAGTKYQLHIKNSSFSDSFSCFLETKDEVLTQVHKIIISTSLVCAVCLAVVGIYSFFKFPHKMCKKWRAPIRIEMPSEQGTMSIAGERVVSIRDVEVHVPNTQMGPPLEAMPMQDMLYEPVDLHQKTTTFPQIDLEVEALIINPQTFIRREQIPLTPLNSGDSGYVGTGTPVTIFGSLDTQLHEDIENTSEDMASLESHPTDEIEQNDDHCRMKMRATPFRDHSAQSQGSDVNIQQPQNETISSINQQQTSTMIIPPPKQAYRVPNTNEGVDDITYTWSISRHV